MRQLHTTWVLWLLVACQPDPSIDTAWRLSKPQRFGSLDLTAAAHIQRPATVAHNGQHFVLAWNDDRDRVAPQAPTAPGRIAYAARIEPTLKLLDSVGLPLFSAREFPLLAAFGDRVLAIRADHALDGSAALWLDAQGKLSESAALKARTLDHVAAIAGDGKTFLLVLTNEQGASRNRSITGVRLDAEGTVLDAAPFVIAEGAGEQVQPSVAFDGTSYLVAWTHRDAASGGGSGASVRARRVSTSGTLLDSAEIAVSSGSSDHTHPSVASDGRGFVVSWWQIGAGVGALSLSSAGAPRGATISLSAAASASTPHIAAASGVYLAAWSESTLSGVAVLGARLDTDGQLLDTTPLVIAPSSSASGAVVGSDGSRFLVAWQSALASGADVYATTVAADGQRASQPLLVSKSTPAQANPAAAWGKDGYLLVWEREADHRRRIVAQRLDADGVPLGGAPVALSAAGMQAELPTVASYGDGFLVAWRSPVGTAYNRLAVRVALDGKPIDTAAVDLGECDSYSSGAVAAAGGSDKTLLPCNGPSGIDGLWVNTSAATLSGDRRPLHRQSGSEQLHFRDVAFDGTRFTVIYEQLLPSREGRLEAVQVTDDGALVGAPTLITDKPVRDARLAYGGGVYLAVWRGLDDQSVHTRRFDPAGGFIDPVPLVIVDSAAKPRALRVAYDGASFVIAWEEERGDAFEGYRHTLLATALTPTGDLVQAAAGVDLFGPVDALSLAPALASDGQGRTLIAATTFEPGPPYGANRVQARLASPPEQTLPRGCACRLGATGADSLSMLPNVCLAMVLMLALRRRRRGGSGC